ncbi:GAF and ANTAR domain-containing protein [Streptomyces sp. HMX87]|uniref:GAF and ANTAR domain-containing protein n=1 Tax=Streptomyces sp. HMX87 TaxID=3390849 RepID=UPI003A865080
MRPSDGHHGGEPGDDDPRPSPVSASDLIAEQVRGAPPGEVPERLCEVAVRLLPVTGASVSLRSDGLPVQLCASSERAAHLSQIQATLGDGPCVQAGATGAPVLARDLTAGTDAEAGRWPVYAQQVTAAGVRAVYALPLGDAWACVGTLDLYRDTPGGLTGPELSTARLVAEAMTTALMALPRALGYEDPQDYGDPQNYGDPRHYRDPQAYPDPQDYRDPQDFGDSQDSGSYEDYGSYEDHGDAGTGEAGPAAATDAARDWPRGRLGGLGGDHDEVHQAVGMIMAQLGVDADEALARLRARAFVRGRTAHDVARDVVAHREHIERDR